MSAPLNWSATDADDRFPGRYVAFCTEATVHGIRYRARITPGNTDTYEAPGFTAVIEVVDVPMRWVIGYTDISPLMHAVEREIEDDAYAASAAV